MPNPITHTGTTDSPLQIERDPAKEQVSKKIWMVFAAIFAASIIAVSVAFPLLPIAVAATALIIASLALAILLASECARRFSKKATVLASLDYEIFSIFLAAGTYFKKDKDLEKVSQEKEPILLVHGYMHNESAWGLFKKRLKKAGVENPVYTISLGHPFQSIEDYSKKVEARLEEIQTKTSCKTVKLIGHSMGGLVSAQVATSGTNKVAVSEVITLGSPLEGTKIASMATILFCGQSHCGNQMKRGSPFLSELKNRIFKSKVKFTHYGSNGDMIVIPQNSANPEGQGFQFSKVGHLFLLYSEQVVDELVKKLKS